MGDILDEAVEIILRTCKNEDVSLFAGAGISLENPANLPSAMELKWDILKHLASQPPKFYDIDRDQTLLQQYLSSEMLEHMVQDLVEALGDHALDILNVFKNGQPNLYHLLIAKLAHQGLINRVFTTNFDILIERALAVEGVKYNVFETEHDFAEYLISPENYTDFPVFKLHGTIAFTKAGEILDQRQVEAISGVKFQARLVRKYAEKQGINTSSIGFERLVTPKDTQIASLDRLGLELSEFSSQVLTKNLETSTFVIIGWNGFDLDISPLFLKSGKKIYWLVHTSYTTKTKMTLSNTEAEIGKIVHDLQLKGWDPTSIQFALLSIGNLPLDTLPSADREREEIIARSGGKSFAIFTPQVVRRLWGQLSNRIGTIPILPDTTEEVKNRIHKYLHTWSESNHSVLGHWGIAKFMVHHGEYDSTHSLISYLLKPVHEQGFHDIESLMYLDLGEVNALYGNREEANRCFLAAIQLFREKVQGRTNKLSTNMLRHRQLVEIPERAYFGMGELACDFFRFKEAEESFKNLSTEESIINALIHFCREEFQESIQLLSEIQFKFRSSTKFHYYLYYYLRLLDADMFWLFKNYENACKLYNEVLVASTKVGWPRHQVHALNGLSKTYSAPGKQCNLWKAAKYAAQAIEVATMAEYRVGRAFAGYYFGRIYAAIGMNDVAEGAIKFSERYFRSMGHDAGLKFCASARSEF